MFLKTLPILVALLSLALPTSAQEQWTGDLTIGVDYQGRTDIENPNGEFDFVHSNAQLRAGRRFGDDARWAFILIAEYRGFAYSFDDLPAGDVWDDIHVVRLGPRLNYRLNDSWSLFGGPVGEFSGERGSEFSDSIRGGARFGVHWHPSERLSLSLGILATNKLADDLWIQPVVLIDWHITDDLLFTTRSWSSRGGRIELIYSLGAGWETSIAGGRERERFRLDSSRAAIGKGVGEENSIPLTLTVAKTLLSGLKIQAYGGAVLDGELRVEDESGDNVAVSDFDRSWFVGGALTVPF